MKVAFLSNFTIDLFAREFQETHKTDLYVSGFDQFRFEIYNPNSNYYRAKPEFTFLILDWDELLNKYSITDLKSEIENLITTNTEILANYIILNNVYLTPSVNSIHSYNIKGNIKEFQLELNSFLFDLKAKFPTFFVLDVLSILEMHGTNTLFDRASWIYGRNKFSKVGMREISRKLGNLVNAIIDRQSKCLVVDLDNTLWGGVLSEEGTFGVQIGTEGPGSEYLAVQKTILAIKNKGAILCICSKNLPQDVLEIFEKNAQMFLKFDDFLLTKIGWQRKDISIREIALELNIGEDSIVFLDDDPTERELVRRNTSAIVPEFPSSIDQLYDFIIRVDEDYFPKLNITVEDTKRTELYSLNLKRDALLDSAIDFKEFINSLKIKVSVRTANPEVLQRLSQLTQKTNQFNLTNKKYTENDLKVLLTSEQFKIFYGEVEDKFGEYGIVLMAILELQKEIAKFDTLLMSCRVIGRGVEEKFIREIVRKVPAVEKFQANFVKTHKNLMIEESLVELGFKQEFIEKSGTHYICDRNTLLKNDTD